MLVLQIVWNLFFLRIVKKQYRKMLEKQNLPVERVVETPVQAQESPILPAASQPAAPMKNYYFQTEEKPKSEKSKDERLMEKVVACIEKNLSKTDFSVEELSHEVGVSRVHLYKKMLAITGKSPLEYIRQERLKKAAQLLEEGSFSVSDVAAQVGFHNPKYFSKNFKEEFGVSPSAYQSQSRDV